MRLTKQQISVIKQTALDMFGKGTQVWLFGSRVDDNKRGGDIDLYIEPEIQEPAVVVDAKLHFLMELHRQLGEQKIDVVIRRADADELPVYRIARETGVKLS